MCVNVFFVWPKGCLLLQPQPERCLCKVACGSTAWTVQMCYEQCSGPGSCLEKREMLLESAPSAKFQSLWKFSSGGDVRLVWNPVTETTTAIFLPHKWRWPGQARKILHSEVLAVRPQRPPLWVHENCSRHRRTGLTVFCLLRLLYVFKFAQYFYYIIFFITFWHQHVEERTLHVLQHIVPVVF